MATLKIVPKEHWEILRQYIRSNDYGAVVLVPQEKLNESTEVESKLLQEANDACIDYDFGGEPDIVIDVLDRADSFCAGEVFSLLSERESKC